MKRITLLLWFDLNSLAQLIVTLAHAHQIHLSFETLPMLCNSRFVNAFGSEQSFAECKDDNRKSVRVNRKCK